MSLENVRKLVTKEDPYHIHKGLGVVCLINFVYRIGLLLTRGSMGFQNPLGVGSILLHGLLSVSSLMFHIPRDRNIAAPMIYPELRLHSITFTLRSVICALCHVYELPFATPFVCIGTMIVADYITYCYKDAANGKTITNMPFDPTMTETEQKAVVYMNSCMQIGATLFMLGSVESAFIPMMAIQGAAFLMTLVRKGVITCTMWHQGYAILLWMSYLAAYSLSPSFLIVQAFMYNMYTRLFFPIRSNKYLNWSIVFAFCLLYQSFPILPSLESYSVSIQHALVTIFFVLQYESAAALFLRKIEVPALKD